jgi:hypothetical protein
LLCEEETGATTRLKYYFVDLPTTASLRALVALTHQRWAIEQQYQELKSELGLDHFEGRSYPGWQHHVVITAVAHAYIQRERLRPQRGPRLTFPAARAIVQEIFTALLFAAKPRYMHWMEQAKQKLQLRIWWSRPGARELASSPSSNRTCGFLAYGFPRCSPCKP